MLKYKSWFFLLWVDCLSKRISSLFITSVFFSPFFLLKKNYFWISYKRKGVNIKPTSCGPVLALLFVARFRILSQFENGGMLGLNDTATPCTQQPWTCLQSRHFQTYLKLDLIFCTTRMRAMTFKSSIDFLRDIHSVTKWL